ncbi:MAG: CidA/LrgA family protein [Dongiaceae bacterium]
MTTIFLLIVLQLVGEAIASVAGLPIPGAVIGLVLLFVLLCARGGARRSSAARRASCTTISGCCSCRQASG